MQIKTANFPGSGSVFYTTSPINAAASPQVSKSSASNVKLQKKEIFQAPPLTPLPGPGSFTSINLGMPLMTSPHALMRPGVSMSAPSSPHVQLAKNTTAGKYFTMDRVVQETPMLEEGSNRMVGKQMSFYFEPPTCASSVNSKRHRYRCVCVCVCVCIVKSANT